MRRRTLYSDIPGHRYDIDVIYEHELVFQTADYLQDSAHWINNSKDGSKNLIRIRCIPKHREVPTRLDNGPELKQANEQHVVLEQHSQRVPIRYNRNQLREIADNINFQKQYKRLTHNTVINVRRL